MIYFGLCSWAEKTLIQSKEFYPRGVDRAEKKERIFPDTVY